LQQELARWFGFRYQMEAIDYGRKNLVHADMSIEEFAAAGGARMGLVPEPGPPGHAAPGKSTLPEAVRSTWDTVRGFGRLALGQPGPLQSLGRRMFAETMGTTDIGTTMDLVPGLTELVLLKRNAVVLATLKAHLGDTKGTIAIFY